VRETLHDAGLRATAADRAVRGRGHFPPAGMEALAGLVRALNALDDEVGGLRWSVRDGQCAVRRHAGRWVLSASAGAVARDAGWFRLKGGPRAPRAALTPAPPLEAWGGHDEEVTMLGSSLAATEADGDATSPAVARGPARA
jgi:hypothetical protein